MYTPYLESLEMVHFGSVIVVYRYSQFSNSNQLHTVQIILTLNAHITEINKLTNQSSQQSAMSDCRDD